MVLAADMRLNHFRLPRLPRWHRRPAGSGLRRLSGQHAEYTIVQLTAFRDGTRKNSQLMTQVAAKLNDSEIKAVADYVAGLR